MSDLHRVGKDLWNFGPLNEPNTAESIRVVQMPGEEIQYILTSKR